MLPNKHKKKQPPLLLLLQRQLEVGVEKGWISNKGWVGKERIRRFNVTRQNALLHAYAGDPPSVYP